MTNLPMLTTYAVRDSQGRIAAFDVDWNYTNRRDKEFTPPLEVWEMVGNAVIRKFKVWSEGAFTCL